MKIKLFLSALMLTFGALTISYASFPVEKTTTNNVTVVENQEDEFFLPPFFTCNSFNDTSTI